MRKVEVVVALGVSTEGGIVDKRRNVCRGTALPTTKHTGTKIVRALLHSESICLVLNGIVKGPLVEFRNLLLQLSEGHERSIKGPRRAQQRKITEAIAKNYPRGHSSLTR